MHQRELLKHAGQEAAKLREAAGVSCLQPSARGSDVSPAIDLVAPMGRLSALIAKAVGALEKGFPGGSVAKNPSAVQATQVRFLGRKDPLAEERVTPSGIRPWEIPRTEEPGGLQFLGL